MGQTSGNTSDEDPYFFIGVELNGAGVAASGFKEQDYSVDYDFLAEYLATDI